MKFKNKNKKTHKKTHSYRDDFKKSGGPFHLGQSDFDMDFIFAAIFQTVFKKFRAQYLFTTAFSAN